MPGRICLFGGTFDPIHIGHLSIATEALKGCSLDRVLFVPGAHPPHKDMTAVTAYADRYRMLEIACAPYPSFSPSRLEADSQPSFTIDTLERLHRDMQPGNELFFLIGADAFAELKSWKRWRDVAAKTRFIVVSRPGADYAVPEGARVTRLDHVDLPISSSSIRRRLNAGELVAEVPAQVREYIQQRGLYGWRNGRQTPVTVLP